MELTGWVLPSVLGALALVVFLALAAGFPRSRRRVFAVPTRVALLVLLNILVLGAAAALLNNQYAFYTSWSDLAGSTGSPAQQSKTEHYGGTAVEAQAEVKGNALKPLPSSTLPQLPQPNARLQRFQVVGSKSRFANEVLVRLPEHYNPHAAGRYPVILALHGFPGHPKAYQRLDGFFSQLDEAARSHRMAESIVVMPLVNHPSTLDTECVDAPGGPQAETWLSHDVPQWVMSHFAARANRGSWVTFGYSFGGWCSAMLGMRHPDVFGGSVVLQGYFRPEFDHMFQPFRIGSPAYEKYDLVKMARRNPPPLAMWVLASKTDRVSYPTTKEFIDAARAPTSITADIPDWGGHRTAVWEGKVSQIFAWMGQTLPGFRP